MNMDVVLIAACAGLFALCASLLWWNGRQMREIAALREVILLRTEVRRIGVPARPADSLPGMNERVYRDALETIAAGALPLKAAYTDEQREAAAGLSGIAWWYMYTQARGIASDALDWEHGPEGGG